MSSRNFTVIGLLIGMFIIIPTNQQAPLSASASYDGQISSNWVKFPEEQRYISSFEDGRLSCQATTERENPLTAENSRTLQPLVKSYRLLTVQGTGNISFDLRIGEGFEANPKALECFMKAVRIWGSLVESPTPISVVVDIDFGPTVFGRPNILGEARPQALIGRGEYAGLRAAMIANANSGKDLALYSSLPETTVPTDIGDTDAFVVQSPLLRVLGLIPPIADPVGEMAQFGPPPAIAINSAAPLDFDPSDGIEQGKFDFLGTSLHELGHLLGFLSRCGSTEVNPNIPLTVSAFDLFRFNPGASMDAFKTAKRKLSSGGEQFFYAGEKEIPLSTARTNGTGGDGFKADHWKDDSFTGSRIGVMDPQLMLGEKFGVSIIDLKALKAMGYRIIGEAAERSPYIEFLKSDLHGDILTLTGSVYDIDADVAEVQIALLDRSGRTLRENEPMTVAGGVKASDFKLNLMGLNNVPAAVQAKVLFKDVGGNRGEKITADFSQADAGGPTLSRASFNGDALIIKGKDLAGPIQIEINGTVVSTTDGNSDKKVKIKADAGRLNIRKGPNRVRLIKNSIRSNIAVLVF